MMLKANSEYFDFDGQIEIESRIRLFESLSKSAGDFSFSIELPNTAHNRKILGIPLPDSIKIIYNEIEVEVINNNGELVNKGKLQVNTIGVFITATFYSGNSEWFSLLSEPLQSLPLNKYNSDLNTANIIASWLLNSGITFPILDTGALVTRSYKNLKVEDFTAFFYVKTVFNEIFNSKGIKITGDLINDPMYNSIGVLSNTKSQDEINARSAYVNKTALQSITILEKVTFQDDSSFPFFDGSNNNYDASISTYNVDADMRLKIDISLILNGAGGLTINALVNLASGKGFSINDSTPSGTININVSAGDVVEIFMSTGGPTVDIVSGTVKFTPTYIYTAFGVSSLPKWTQMEFVSNVLRIFNVLPSYDNRSKTLTLDLFNKIKSKEPIDISDSIVIDLIDYSDFVSDYAKSNLFSYQESEDEDLRKYNIANFVSYGSGELLVDNDYIENSTEIVESDFTSPITYLNGIFDMSMERINFVELDEVDNYSITGVNNSGGTPRFLISNADTKFNVGDLVRIDVDVDGYNGEWVISAVTTTYITVNGLAYSSNSTGDAILLLHEFTTDDNVYMFASIVNLSVNQFSSKTSMLIENTSFTSASVAYFNILSNGQEINNSLKQGLSFGPVNNPLSYQLTILETYWPIVSIILNDPVMLNTTGYFKKVTYDEMITFLRPLRVNTNESTNLYYLNRLTGYKSGHEPCEAELIKL